MERARPLERHRDSYEGTLGSVVGIPDPIAFGRGVLAGRRRRAHSSPALNPAGRSPGFTPARAIASRAELVDQPGASHAAQALVTIRLRLPPVSPSSLPPPNQDEIEVGRSDNGGQQEQGCKLGYVYAGHSAEVIMTWPVRWTTR